jgi:outer membrane protein
VNVPSGRVLRLEDAVALAVRRQPQILQAQASTRAANARADEARSGLLPQVVGTASYTLGEGTGPGTPTVAGTGTGAMTGAMGAGGMAVGTAQPATSLPSNAPGGQFAFAATASQLIYDFGQTYDRYRAARRLADSFSTTEKTTELGIVLNVRRAFFAARAQRALIQVAEDTLENQEKHMVQIEGNVKVGTRPEIDLAQARSDIAQSRVAVINAQNAYLIAKAQLNQAMGVVDDTAYDVADEGLPAVDGEELPTATLVERAVTARPELVALQRQRESQELSLSSARGGYGPTLGASAGAAEAGPAIDNLFGSWNVRATLTWPVFQGGLTVGQVHEAEANLDITRFQTETERLQIRFDIEQAVLTLRAAKASLDASKDGLVNARERLRLAEGRYTSGVGSIIELGDAQVALANAAGQVVSADFNLATARAQLLAALGRR